jgi:hypothetical protein
MISGLYRYCLLLLAGCLLAGGRCLGDGLPPVDDIAKQVDASFTALWADRGLQPAVLTSDPEFVRRAYFTLLGRPPAVGELQAFLDDPSPNKRPQAIDSLLRRAESAEYWATIWSIRLLGRQALLRQEDLYYALYGHLERAFASNQPLGDLVTSLLIANGKTTDQPQAAFLTRWADTPATVAGQVSRVFLGVRFNCAQCHDHPYEAYSQQQFWQTAAFFGGLYAKRPDREKMENFWTLSQRPQLQLTIPDTDRKVSPMYPLSATPPIPKPDDRRRIFAERLLAPESPYFARAQVNWTWAQFFGQGLINPIDDMSIGDRLTASNPAVYDLLVADFTASNYDFRRLMAIIARTTVWQLSSTINATNQWDRQYHARFIPRALSPEQLFNALIEIGGIERVVAGSLAKGKDAERYIQQMRQYMRSVVQLYDNDEMTESLHFEGTVPQALFLLNSAVTNDFLLLPGGHLQQIANDKKERRVGVDRVFQMVLGREPTTSEDHRFGNYVRRGKYSAQALGDVAWVLLNSSEFSALH